MFRDYQRLLIRVFTLKFNTVTEQFDDTELQKFLVGQEVLTVREHFFIRHNMPYLVVFLTYHAYEQPAGGAALKKPAKEEWRTMLTQDQLPLFNTLRDWRNARAKDIGVPPYAIATNRQLAEVTATHPTTLAALAKIQGFGAARLKSYGMEILTILAPQSTLETTLADTPQTDLFTSSQKPSVSNDTASQPQKGDA